MKTKRIKLDTKKRNCKGHGFDIDGTVVGVIHYEMREREYVILHLDVQADFRRCRIGTHMVDWLQNKLVHPGGRLRGSRDRIVTYAPIGREHHYKYWFLQKCGFTAVEVDGQYMFTKQLP